MQAGVVTLDGILSFTQYIALRYGRNIQCDWLNSARWGDPDICTYLPAYPNRVACVNGVLTDFRLFKIGN